MFNTDLTARLTIALSLFLYYADVHGEPVINLYPGELHGTTITTRNGRNISAFLGIPYAEPPVGRLRFRPPQRTELEGDIMANVDGNQCPQLNEDGEVVGDEDCLYLNIYTPEISPKTAEDLRPTMVYFHGGNFERGSGSSVDAGPEYLLDRDIVLVTVNYRLGALGFLSTEDAQAPGNWGLKDQVAALQWIRWYIVLFGGAVTPLTIFGQGAGGVSTSLHAISDQSNNLFDRYISQSGNALSLWAVGAQKGSHRRRANGLGEYLNCPTDKSADLVNCLRNADAYRLVDFAGAFNDAADTPWLITTWAPVQEVEADGAFLTLFPLHKMLTKGIKDCPAILGNVRDEGLLFTEEFYVNDTKYDAVTKDLTSFMRSTVARFLDSNPSNNPNKMFQDFYFKDVSPDEDRELITRNMTAFVTNAEFRYPTNLQMRILSGIAKSHVYSYTFDYRGTFSKTSATIGNNDDIGVTHGDDMTYLFPIKSDDYEPSESNLKMVDIMVDFWTSFARTGIPTSEYLADPNVWKPSNNKTDANVVDSNMPTLHIGYNNNPTDMEFRAEIDDSLFLWDRAIALQIGKALSNS